MNKRQQWLLFVVMENCDMHSFDYGACVWCGMKFGDWITAYGSVLCNCGENDLPKPEREVML